MRNVVVTGGSRGLGLAIAKRLAAAGYGAIAVARKENAQLASAMAAADGARAIRFVPFDLRDIDAIPRFVAKLRKSFGPIYGCKFARNNDPLRGDFASNSDPS
jgi:3-oxoacyl-[acyl-carrier protein] reductase